MSYQQIVHLYTEDPNKIFGIQIDNKNKLTYCWSRTNAKQKNIFC